MKMYLNRNCESLRLGPFGDIITDDLMAESFSNDIESMIPVDDELYDELYNDGCFSNWNGGTHSQFADYVVYGVIAVYCDSNQDHRESLEQIVNRAEEYMIAFFRNA